MSRQEPISVLLTTEGTYPFYTGGVSTWCHNLTQKLPEIDFRIFAVTTNPYSGPRYELADNVLEIVKAPLWGTMHPSDYSWHLSLSEILRSRLQATPQALLEQYLPLWERFLLRIFCND